MPATDPVPQPECSDPEAMSPGTAPFPVSSDSPFADGYDIASERDALADLVAAADPDRADPRWPRLIELRERENDLREATPGQSRHRAPAVAVAPKTAGRLEKLGQLADATPDTMT